MNKQLRVVLNRYEKNLILAYQQYENGDMNDKEFKNARKILKEGLADSLKQITWWYYE